jgi:uncharacterized protein (UPF0332 family)
MSPRGTQLIEGANQALASAQSQFQAGDLDTAAERACVAMIRLAKACLEIDDLTPGPAQAVCREYGEHFVQTGRMYSAYYRWLLDAADLRKAAGSGFAAAMDGDAVATVLERAEIFRDATSRFVTHNAQ